MDAVPPNVPVFALLLHDCKTTQKANNRDKRRKGKGKMPCAPTFVFRLIKTEGLQVRENNIQEEDLSKRRQQKWKEGRMPCPEAVVG